MLEAMLPSEVFCQRVRETRRSRNLTQTQLAAEMTRRGRPMTRAALLGIETGKRGLSLDEALGLAETLRAAFANLLSPPDGALLAPADTMAMDGEALRRWLVTGVGVPVWPVELVTDDFMEERLVRLAIAMGDASRIGDHAGVTEARRQIVAEVRQYVALTPVPA